MSPEKVVKHFGGVKATAAAIGMTTDVVYKWQRNGYIPYTSQIIIQLASDGKFTAKRDKK